MVNAPAGRSRRGRRGSISLLVVVILAGVAVMALAVASVSLTTTRLARTAQDRVTGVTLAEAGVDDMVARLTADSAIVANLGSSSAYTPCDQSSCTLYEDSAQTKPEGTYRATLTWVDKPSGRLKVVSTGTNANGTTRTVVARLNQGSMKLGGAAIVANGPISISGNADVETTKQVDPPAASNAHNADVYGNGDVTLGGSATVDGRLISADTVTGTAYYPSQSNAPEYPFPSSADTALMNVQWMNLARGSGSTTYDASKLFSGKNTSVTVTAPAYITGDLKMVNGQTLTIAPNPNARATDDPAASQDIVYLDGDLSMSAKSSIVNGATFIVGGSFSQNGTATYAIDKSVMTATLPGTTQLKYPTPSMTVYSGDITLNGSSSNALWGILYTVNGGIKVNGNAVFTGALIAGGEGSPVSVKGTYNQYFPEDMAAAISLPSTPVVTQIEEL